MAEIAVGALRSKIELTLHTYHATRTWWGRGVESGKPQIIGMRQYLALAGRIQQNAAKDDPYADDWMLRIDAKLDEVRNILDPIYKWSMDVLADVPEELNIEENISQKPFKTGVYPGGQQGWQGIHLLIRYDRVVRNILLAQHIAMITRDEAHEKFRVSGNAIRSLCTSTQRYPGLSGTTRDDFEAQNARARAAIDKWGELHPDVLSCARRSPYAPIARTPVATTESGSGNADTKSAAPDLDQLQLEVQAAKPEEVGSGQGLLGEGDELE